MTRAAAAAVAVVVGALAGCHPPFAPGCPFALEPGLNAHLSVLGIDRTAFVSLPASPGPHAAVFAFHGHGGSAVLEVDAMSLSDHEDDTVIVSVAARDADAIPVWEDGSDSPDDNPDLALFDNLLACAVRDLDVDPDRVTAAGVSGGAFFTAFLVKARGDALAAAAMFSGFMRRGVGDDEPATPMLISYGGDSDHTAGLDANGVVTADIDYTKESRAQIPVLREAGHVVAACNTGQGHGLPEDGGATMLWPFLSVHTRGQPSPFATATPAGFPSFCSVDAVP